MEYRDVLMRPNVRPAEVSDADITDFIDEISLKAKAQTIYFL